MNCHQQGMKCIKGGMNDIEHFQLVYREMRITKV
jgi:hypothetical protein